MSSACLKCGSFPTIKAHIFPQAALKRIRSRGPDTKLIALDGYRSKIAKRQNGIFDPNILCSNCDGLLGKLDDWFLKLINDITSVAHSKCAYEPFLLDIDPKLATRFAISIVYRASLSSRIEFQHVQLGRFSSFAENIVFDTFEVSGCQPIIMMNVLTSSSLDMRQMAFYPVKCANGNGPYFVFAISGIQFLVKFGGRHSGLAKSNDLSQNLRLRVGQPVVAVSHPFEDSAEGQFMLGVARASKRRSYGNI